MSEKEKNSVPFTKAGLKSKADDAAKKETEAENAADKIGELPKQSKKSAQDNSDDIPLH